MEFDFWWLPGAALFFALGWLAARRESSRQPTHHQAVLPGAYLRGLQALLGEDSLRATDAFTELVRNEPDNLELHFALGHLFRRKGETDRAIRVHQNLLTRQDLTAQSRAELQRELALDYMKAGLFDRAEQSLQSLRSGPLHDEALRLRLDLAQRVRDWPLALSIAREIAEQNARQGQAGLAPTLLGHLYAEIAQQRIHEGKADEAWLALQDAKAVAPDHPRAWVESCLLSIGLDKLGQADEAARAILERWPEQAARIASAWLNMGEATHHGQDKDLLTARRFEALEMAYQRAASFDLLTTLLDHLDRAQGPAAAYTFLNAHREHHRGLLSMLAQIKRREISDPSHHEKHQACMKTGQANDQAFAVKLANDEALFQGIIKLLEQLALQSARYVCKHCGFQANRHYWQCPGCHQWDRYPPQRTDEISRS